MKVFISADIEGVTGINSWDETEKSHKDYEEFREQMTREVVAACEGALAAGATEIVIKDAHDSGRNLIAARLPREAKLIRSWSRHPYSMVWGLDETFDAVCFVGYHSPSGTNFNPLSHTMSSVAVAEMRLNGDYCSEFLMHTLVARSLQVPAVFCSGDKGLCGLIKEFDPQVETVAVNEGVGNATVSIHPDMACDLIRENVKKALTADLSRYDMAMPENYVLDTRYHKHVMAFKASHYPGAELIDPATVRFTADNILDVMRFVLFCV